MDGRGRGRGRARRPYPQAMRPNRQDMYPSQTFSNHVRASSACPTLNESIDNLSINTPSAVPKDTRSQSVRQAPRRRGLCSAVPDSAELVPIDRPDDGGRKGREITVHTNHFRLDLDENTTVYQYDIEIVLIDRNNRVRQANNDNRWDALQLLLKERKDFPVVWYDEGKTLYTRQFLPELNLPIKIQLKNDDETKTLQINKLAMVDQRQMKDIYDFIKGEKFVRPQEAIRIIEILLKQQARSRLISIRNQFYDRRKELEDLGDGRGMAKGFYQALFLTQCGPTLNVNLSFTCFYMPLNFVDFVSQYLRVDIIHQHLHENDLKKFEKYIRTLKIETMHTGRRIIYRFGSFGRSAEQTVFIQNNNEASNTTLANERITVAKYFEQKYRRLLYPHLPCINAVKGAGNKPNWLPMEFVRVLEWQRAVKPLDKTQRGAVSQNTIIPPHERYDEIIKIVRNNQYNRDSFAKELNIRVKDDAMMTVPARVLDPPDIAYRRRGKGEIVEHVSVGKWKIRNWFFNSPPIDSWGLIYFSDRPNNRGDNVVEEFQQQLPELLGRIGFEINCDLNLITRSTRENDIFQTLTYASQQRWQLAIIVMNSYDCDTVYNLIKKYANSKLGLMTQCVNYQALKRNIRKLNMYVENIAQKINGKLGGINGVVNIRSALTRSSREDLFMFFGADVTHWMSTSSDRPSIAAVVGSRDLTNTLYAARICEQYPKRGRCSIEIIKELDRMVVELLRLFANSCGNRLPTKIVFYRDGVDDGQYQKVLAYEVNKIKAACRIVYGNLPQPLLTFIVVKKRHNTRFFVRENNQKSNVEAGTVIDQQITHPTQFDFYLCSQSAIMGTSRPALYHVLHDDIGFSSDEIQQLTYWLCYTDMRCTKSVSIPAPVHYAHLAAYSSRALKFGEEQDRESIHEENEEPENYTLEDVNTKLMVLDEKIADDM